jgi:hypothetical protein
MPDTKNLMNFDTKKIKQQNYPNNCKKNYMKKKRLFSSTFIISNSNPNYPY